MAARNNMDEDEASILPRPEEFGDLIGHEAAERELLSALRSGRMHHAWMITGAKGVGKATLAFRFARFLLRHGRDERAIGSAKSLAVPPEDPIARQVASGAAQDLLVLRRPVDEKTGKEKSVIPVEELRKLQRFFGLAAGAGGWRVAIIDSVDEMNRNSANALLKSLEEPPERAILLLVANAPGRTLATIRSRCRTLHLSPMSETELATTLPALGARLGLADLPLTDYSKLASLSGGSVGRALTLWAQGGLSLARAVDEILSLAPDFSSPRGSQLLDELRGDFSVSAELLVAALRRAARSAVMGEAEQGAGTLQRSAPETLAELAGELESFFARGQGINLDERAMMGEALRRIAGARAS